MIYLGADHGGYELKEKLKQWLKKWGYRHEDCGPYEYDPEDDYPDFAAKIAKGVSKGVAFHSVKGNPLNRGIVICRNGVGVSIVANKFKGVRCALGFDRKQIEKARLDDDANVLALPADYLTNETAKSIVKIFLKTEFSGEERHERRLRKVAEIELKVKS